MPNVGKGLEKRIQELLNSSTNVSYTSYRILYNKIKKIAPNPKYIPSFQQLKFFVIGASTLEPITTCLEIEALKAGFFPISQTGEFNQYQQEILDPNSLLYSFSPQLVFFLIPLEYLLPHRELLDLPIDMTSTGIENRIKTIIDEIKNLINILLERLHAIVVFSNFVVPSFSPVGILDNHLDTGLQEFVTKLNLALIQVFKDQTSAFLFDMNQLTAKFGQDRAFDPRFHFRGSIEFSSEFLPVLGSEFVRYLKAATGNAKKCLILDLDDTLWGGIVGEEGLSGIKLGPTFPGKEYYEFQETILSLYKRGILLTIVSKNNHEDVLEVLKDHQYMLLREEYFAAIRINWENKVDNIVSIAEELNIGLDSMVFLDDSPVERELVRQALPQVLVPELPTSSLEYRQFLENLNVFDVLALTEEDRRKSELYAAKRQREGFKKTIGSLNDYLASLQIKIKIALITNESLQRTFMLIGKTNQFNLTTRRRTLPEIQELMENPNFRLFGLWATDKFGDEGQIGICIIEIKNSSWYIDTFLLSCRVLGRGIEQAFLATVASYASTHGASKIIGEYFPTKKNKQTETFYLKTGFDLAEKSEKHTSWFLEIPEQLFEPPAWITIEKNLPPSG
ncbi:MAG: HAD-IIIC family phosphatase [Promethearchaeota archaeon]